MAENASRWRIRRSNWRFFSRRQRVIPSGLSQVRGDVVYLSRDSRQTIAALTGPPFLGFCTKSIVNSAVRFAPGQKRGGRSGRLWSGARRGRRVSPALPRRWQIPNRKLQSKRRTSGAWERRSVPMPRGAAHCGQSSGQSNGQNLEPGERGAVEAVVPALHSSPSAYLRRGDSLRTSAAGFPRANMVPSHRFIKSR